MSTLLWEIVVIRQFAILQLYWSNEIGFSLYRKAVGAFLGCVCIHDSRDNVCKQLPYFSAVTWIVCSFRFRERAARLLALISTLFYGEGQEI